MIENFANVEAEIYGGVPDVPLKITCSLNVDASFWLQMFSAKLMLHRISMQFLMMGNASKNSKYHWIPLLNFAHNVWCSIFFWFSTKCSRNLRLWKLLPKLQSNETKLDLKKQILCFFLYREDLIGQMLRKSHWHHGAYIFLSRKLLGPEPVQRRRPLCAYTSLSLWWAC